MKTKRHITTNYIEAEINLELLVKTIAEKLIGNTPLKEV